jgi:hypothetical protein
MGSSLCAPVGNDSLGWRGLIYLIGWTGAMEKKMGRGPGKRINEMGKSLNPEELK